ncbi:hypothetical protein JCM10207_000038 [Rhodosporidiobolus poonsookiae]
MSSPSASPLLAPALLPLLFLLASFLAPLAANAAALPSRPSAPATQCTPTFSGLSQEIRKAGQPNVLWKAKAPRAGSDGARDGVKADVLDASLAKGALPPAFEWVVEDADERGVFAISSAASTTCATSTLAQAAFSTSCSTPHLFRIRCAACDAHEDSASNCFLQSAESGMCVELLPSTTAKRQDGTSGRARLGWSECAWMSEGEGWSRRKDQLRARQLWDIAHNA